MIATQTKGALENETQMEWRSDQINQLSRGMKFNKESQMECTFYSTSNKLNNSHQGNSISFVNLPLIKLAIHFYIAKNIAQDIRL